METNEVSAHLLRVWRAIRDKDGWHTSEQVSKTANVAPRTARAHLLRLVQLGLADQAEVFPAHRYRASALASKRNKAMVQRLAAAEEVFGAAG